MVCKGEPQEGGANVEDLTSQPQGTIIHYSPVSCIDITNVYTHIYIVWLRL